VSCWSPASVDLVGATMLLIKRPLEGFCHLCRLSPVMMKSPAGCWRSRPFGRSRPLWPVVLVILGTSAGRWLCPWPTQTVIPMTLALETGEVSWVSMGLWRVLFLAEVDSHPSKSEDLPFGLEVVVLEAKLWRTLPAVSGRTGSRTELARGCSVAASRHLAPRNLNLLKTEPTLLLA
jgi:hypothetical protein